MPLGKRWLASAETHRRSRLSKSAGRTAVGGPLLKFAGVCFRACLVHRGRRCPRRAHAVAVGALRRLHCDARAGVVPQNSLRDLRSLRSNSRGKSVHEARSRAPTPALRFSSPQKSPPAGSACREVHRRFGASRMPPLVQQRHARAGESALRLLTRRRCPNAATAGSEVSSATGPRDRASQGSRRAAPTAEAKRRSLPERAFAAPNATRTADVELPQRAANGCW